MWLQNTRNNFLSILDVLFAVESANTNKVHLRFNKSLLCFKPLFSAYEPFTQIPAQKLFIRST